jgi:hypothetical protein
MRLLDGDDVEDGVKRMSKVECRRSNWESEACDRSLLKRSSRCGIRTVRAVAQRTFFNRDPSAKKPSAGRGVFSGPAVVYPILLMMALAVSSAFF